MVDGYADGPQPDSPEPGPLPDEACRLCRYYGDDGNLVHRACRRRAPVADPETGGSIWPRVSHNDWCGEFEPALHGYRRGSAMASWSRDKAENARQREALERIRVASEFHAQDGIADHVMRYAHESTFRLANEALADAVDQTTETPSRAQDGEASDG